LRRARHEEPRRHVLPGDGTEEKVAVWCAVGEAARRDVDAPAGIARAGRRRWRCEACARGAQPTNAEEKIELDWRLRIEQVAAPIEYVKCREEWPGSTAEVMYMNAFLRKVSRTVF